MIQDDDSNEKLFDDLVTNCLEDSDYETAGLYQKTKALVHRQQQLCSLYDDDDEDNAI